MSGEYDNKDQLKTLLDSRHPAIRVTTTEEHYILEMLREIVHGQDGIMLTGWSATWGVHEGMFSLVYPQADTDTLHPAAGMSKLVDDRSWHIAYVLDVVGYLQDERTLRAARDLIQHCGDTNRTVVFIDHRDDVPVIIAAHTTRFEVAFPGENELEQIVRNTLKQLHVQEKIEIDINRKQLNTILRNLRGLNRRQARQVIRDTVVVDRRFSGDDVNHIAANKRRALHSDGLLEYIETPVDLSSIGGLKKLKQWLQLRRDADTQSAHEYGINPPRGVMMLGVQGAGKSMCAKAIATAWERPLLRMDPGRLYDRYIGESERRLRDALRQAEAMAPIVLWIDEIEKGFAGASSRSIDGGLSKRIFGTLLTWMQEHEEPVFMVATANDIEALPPELLRKGRFDEIFFVDLPTPDTRREIWKIHLEKRNQSPDKFDIEALVAASDGRTGAEIEQAIISGLHDAFATKQDLNNDRLLDALEQSPPLSVTMAEKIASLRRWADGRCVPADE